MRVLGIDPGSRVTGYGVIEAERGKLHYVASGCIRLGSSTHTMSARLGALYEAVNSLLLEQRPDHVVLEMAFVARNAASALKLGEARGAALAAVVANRLPVAEYAPRRVKQAVTGTGAAVKSQVQHMVRLLLELNAAPSSDAADALALAICHVHCASWPVSTGRRRVGRRR